MGSRQEQLVDQRAVFARDRYENTFFQLVSLHHQIVNDTIHIEEPDQIVGTQIKLLGQPRPPNQEYRGRDCFARIYNAFRDRYRETVRSQGPMAIEACLERVYEPIYVEYQADLGHYFRHLYTICKFVDRSTIQDKQLYISIIRAQLSSFEFLLLFYNGLSKHGVEKFKPLIEEHGILKNIPLAQLLESDHQERYAESAFER